MNENNFGDKKEFNNVEVLEPISLSNDININSSVGLNNIDDLNVSNKKSEDSLKKDSMLSVSNLDGNSMEAQNTDVIDLIPKTLGNFFFHYLFHSVKWFFFIWVISVVVIATIFDLFFSSYIIFWIILFLDSYVVQHFALSDVFKKECLYHDEANKFLIFLFIVYPVLFVIFVFLIVTDFYLLDMVVYYIFGHISVFLNRKMIKAI